MKNEYQKMLLSLFLGIIATYATTIITGREKEYQHLKKVEELRMEREMLKTLKHRFDSIVIAREEKLDKHFDRVQSVFDRIDTSSQVNKHLTQEIIELSSDTVELSVSPEEYNNIYQELEKE